MRCYEIIVIIHPDKGEQIQRLIKHYKSTIEKEQGEIYHLEDWGKRYLSYAINEVKSAYYILMRAKMTTTCMHKIQKILNTNEDIIRSMIVKTKNFTARESYIAD